VDCRAYIGDINNTPQLTCVFQSDDAQNEFLSNPKIGLGEDIYDDNRSEGAGADNTGDQRKKTSSNKEYSTSPGKSIPAKTP
jgi:hypothetical protein